MKSWLDRVRWIALAVIIVAACFHYRFMFRHLMILFGDALEDMSHGYVVPFVSLWALWRQRQALRPAAMQPSWAGAAWVTLILAAAWLGHRGGQSRIELVSFIGLVWALPYAFWGREVERLMRFPAAFLLFMVPISTFVDFITMYLRMASVVMATGVLNGFGLAVERSGTALYSQVPGGTFNVDVAEPCSGIRSLFAMMALTAAYAYATQKTFWRKWALFACSPLIAVIGNMVRIMSICAVASWLGQDIATGYYHDYSGFVIFGVGVLLMFSAGEWIKKVSFRVVNVNERAQKGALAAVGGWRSGFVVVTGVTVLALSVFMAGNLIPMPACDTMPFVADALPERVGEFDGDVPWFCQNPQCLAMAEQRMLKRATVDGEEAYVCPDCGKLMRTVSLGEATLLPKGTVILKRNYRASDGLLYAVSVVVQGWNRNSIHRPELCLPSQGFILDKARDVSLRLDGRLARLKVRQINAHRSAGGGRERILQDGKLVWMNRADSARIPGISLVYWFESRERESCSHVVRILTDVWDRSIHNRINRWVMVAVNVSSEVETPESYERLEAFLAEFMPKVLLKK